MSAWEYKVVPAPARGEKAKGVKGAEARFAYALQRIMNEMGAEGWEYQRSETLPSEERSGLTSKVTNWRNVLVFRREMSVDASFEDGEPAALLEAPEPDPAPAAVAATAASGTVVLPVEDDEGFGHFEAVEQEPPAQERDPLLRRLEEMRADAAGGQDLLDDSKPAQDLSDPGPVLRERAARMQGKDDGFAAE